MEHQEQNMENEANHKIDNLLADPAKKAAILQRLARPHLSHSGPNGGEGCLPSPSGLANPHAPQGTF